MKRTFAAFSLFVATSLSAQVGSSPPGGSVNPFGVGSRITAGTTVPAKCLASVVLRDVFYKSGSSAGIYVCTATNTWSLISTANAARTDVPNTFTGPPIVAPTDSGAIITILRTGETASAGTSEGVRPDAGLYVFSTDEDAVTGAGINVDVRSRYLPVDSATITSGGSGYTTCTATFGASPTGDTATATCTPSAGAIGTITITNGGDYTSGGVPAITIGGNGTGGAATAVLRSFIRTGIHVKSFTNPDNGGESSSIIGVSTGGGTAGTFYHYTGLRPAGYEDYADSLQPALEVATDTKSVAGLFTVGADVAGSPHTTNAATALLAVVNNAGSQGIGCSMADLAWDDRICYFVGSHQSNAAPVNLKWFVRANGNVETVGTYTGTGDLTLNGTNASRSIVVNRLGTNPASIIISAQPDVVYFGSSTPDPVVMLYGSAESYRTPAAGVITSTHLTLAQWTALAVALPDSARGYCSDCVKNSVPCTGSGTGSMIKKEAGALNCD